MTYAIGHNLPTCSYKRCCQPATVDKLHLPHDAKPETFPTPVDYCAEHGFKLEMLAMHGLPTTLVPPTGRHDA